MRLADQPQQQRALLACESQHSSIIAPRGQHVGLEQQIGIADGLHAIASFVQVDLSAG